ncbi:energy-coupling factor ABC transporter ATP-binding protein [uncultured Varibaculum sp.]|uniref:energy-coupling factor ABC transporter ATP-binding protein n=1 Tax=uncultured Varibaculum sp. TaxID=413896 RepID=UPI0025842409|nr:ATP-binding cassette domain-containing protein [uncultured Varibaculum sp.]
MKPVIEVKDFSFYYRGNDHPALSNLNFSVAQGSFVCLVGESGAGKSTLCHALVGLIPHYFTGSVNGSVEVFGDNAADSSIAELSQNIGLVFQNPFNQLSYTAGTVAEELAYGLGNHGIPRLEMKERVQKVAHIMHIEDLLEQNPLMLSGGQVQRVAFGSTFILEPKILVLDECTSQLDPLGSAQIFDIVKQLNSTGITIVMVDNDMTEVARCADRVLVLHQGKIAMEGSPVKVFTDPRLKTYGVDPPDYVDICTGLIDSGVNISRIEITETPTVNAVKHALARGGEAL